MHQDARADDEELRRDFLLAGRSFFSWNSGKNTPNILLKLEQRLGSLEASTCQITEAISKLDESVRAASASSTSLASALNKLTLAYVIVTGLGVLVASVALIWQIMK